jgi:hypothetical protein
MAETLQRSCDGCGADLTFTKNFHEPYLHVMWAIRESRTRFEDISLAFGPSFKGDRDFCNIDCLRAWLDREFPPDKGPYPLPPLDL